MGRKRVTAGDGDFRAAERQQFDEVRRLRLDVHRHADDLAGERLFRLELLAELLQDGHVLERPVHLASSLRPGGLDVVEVLGDGSVVFAHTRGFGEGSENPTEGGRRPRIYKCQP